MRNIDISQFVAWDSMFDNRFQYAIMKKEFSPDACRCRMVSNIHDEEMFVPRVLETLKSCADAIGVTCLFTWDKDLGTNTFIFKVGVTGYIMIACDDLAIVREVFESEEEVESLKKELVWLRQEFIKMLSKR